MKKLVLILFVSVLTNTAFGQQTREQKKSNSLDFGPLLGISNYFGDFTYDYQPIWSQSKPAGGLLCRYNLNTWITLRASALFGQIQGADKNLSGDPYRKRRNLSFKSDIIEFSGQVEWNIIGYESTRTSYAWSPYLFIGIAVYRFNPKAQLNYVPGLHDPSIARQDGDWVELQPLGTEGQETTKFNDKRRYALTQVCIPFGLGAKWQLDDAWAIGIEMGVRKTFTDYLDDVSTVYVDDQVVGGANGPLSVAFKDRSQEIGQEKFSNNEARGNDRIKDYYLMGGLTLTYKILGAKTVCFNF